MHFIGASQMISPLKKEKRGEGGYQYVLIKHSTIILTLGIYHLLDKHIVF
jgi:hypothetical protein